MEAHTDLFPGHFPTKLHNVGMHLVPKILHSNLKPCSYAKP